MRKFLIAMCTCLGFAMAGIMTACFPTNSLESSTQSESPTLEFIAVPEDMTVFATTEIIIPQVEYVEGAELLISVNAPSGAAVTVIDGKFVAETAGDYIITYTLKSGEAIKTETITVTAVLPTTKPTLTVEEGTPARILVGELFTLKTGTAVDALNQVCAVNVKVTDPNGEEVTVTDGAFIPAFRGEYIITYTATDAFDNSDFKSITVEAYAIPQAITPVEDGVKNSFETEDESFLDKLNQETSGATFSRIDTLDNSNEVRSGAYSLKVAMSKGGTFNFLSETLTGSKSLTEVGTLSFWVYNANEEDTGFSIYGVTLVNGSAQKTEVYKVLEVGAWMKYELNLVEKCNFTAEELRDTYALTIWTESGGTFYLDDITWDNRSDYAEVWGVEATASADWNVEYTVPTASVSEGTELTVTVTAPDGSTVEAVDGKFTTSQGGVYIITYTGTKGQDTMVKTTELTVVRPEPKPVAPVDESVKNSFETEEECYLDTLGAKFSRNDTYMNANAVRSGAYSLKITTSASGTVSVLTPVFTGSNSLAEVGKLSFWVYNGNEAATGFSIYKIILKDNSTVTPNIYKSLPVPVAGSEGNAWTKYEINLIEDVNFTAEQLKDVWAIQMHIGSAGVVYIDDISWDNRSDYAEVWGVEATASADWNVEYTVPTASVSEGTELTVTVTAPDGSTVEAVDGKFTTSQGGVYIITYTGTKGEDTMVKTTELTVVRPEPKPVAPVDDSVKNSFETLEECCIGGSNGINATYFSHNDTYMNANGVRSGAYSLKLNATSVTEYWIRPQVITGSSSLSEVGTLSFWVYNASDTAKGFSIYKLLVGSTSQVVDVYISIPAGTWKEFKLNFVDKVTYTAEELANAPILTLRPASTGVFYIDDISWDNRSDYVSIGSVAQTATAIEGEEYTLETPTVSSNATLEISVLAPDGTTSTPEGTLLLEQVGTYVITYTAKGEVQEKSVTTTITVNAEDIIPENVQSFEDATEMPSSIFTVSSGAATITLNTDRAYARSGKNSIKLSPTEGNFNFNILVKGLFGSEDLSKYSAIKFYIYNTATANKNFQIASTIASTGYAAITYKPVTVMAANAWTEITIDLTDAAFDENKNVWSFRGWMPNGFDYYLDDITFVDMPIPENVESFEDATEMPSSIFTVSSGAATITLNTDRAYARSGKNSIKLSPTEGNFNFNILPKGLFGKEDLSAYSAIKFYVYNTATANKNFQLVKTIPSSGTISYSHVTTLAAGKWTEVTIDLTNTAFDENKSVWSFRWWMPNGFDYYLDDITFIEMPIPDNVKSFEDVTDVSSMFSGGTVSLNTDKTYARSGSNSVKLEFASGTTFTMSPAGLWGSQDLSKYSAIKMYVYCDTGSKYIDVQSALASGASSRDTGCAASTKTVANEWVELTIDLTKLQDATTSNVWAFYHWFAAGTYYIDDVTFVEKA